VDFVALSFVQKPEDIQEIKAIIESKGMTGTSDR
jgi:pyruvate kinase